MKELLRLNKTEVKTFFNLLSESISRFIERVIILPLHGHEATVTNVTEAIDFIENYSEVKPNQPLIKYEIIIKYNTTDRIEASFIDKKDAIKFLESYL